MIEIIKKKQFSHFFEIDEQLAGMLPDYIPQPNKEPTEQEVHEQPQIVQNRTDAIERVMVSTEYATNETDIELQPLVDSNFNFTDIIPNKLNNHVNGKKHINKFKTTMFYFSCNSLLK